MYTRTPCNGFSLAVDICCLIAFWKVHSHNEYTVFKIFLTHKRWNRTRTENKEQKLGWVSFVNQSFFCHVSQPWVSTIKQATAESLTLTRPQQRLLTGDMWVIRLPIWDATFRSKGEALVGTKQTIQTLFYERFIILIRLFKLKRLGSDEQQGLPEPGPYLFRQLLRLHRLRFQFANCEITGDLSVITCMNHK